ncbi:hypothetical protein MMC06_004226 [Schaereria dolodes]|nr:hypothetical protein [Schaereria dolodes]
MECDAAEERYALFQATHFDCLKSVVPPRLVFDPSIEDFFYLRAGLQDTVLDELIGKLSQIYEEAHKKFHVAIKTIRAQTAGPGRQISTKRAQIGRRNKCHEFEKKRETAFEGDDSSGMNYHEGLWKNVFREEQEEKAALEAVKALFNKKQKLCTEARRMLEDAEGFDDDIQKALQRLEIKIMERGKKTEQERVKEQAQKSSTERPKEPVEIGDLSSTQQKTEAEDRSGETTECQAKAEDK